MQPTSFSQLSLQPSLLSNLERLGYLEMTPVQQQALPLVLAGKDLIVQAETGSGKTAAFSLGLLERIDLNSLDIQALVLCPTRELAEQITKEIRRLGSSLPNLKVLTLCGGTPAAPQRASLEFGAHIVVGTPGRVEDLIKCRALFLKRVKYLVLDEADRMLDMGFKDVLDEILSYVAKNRQTLLFSATYPPEIKAMSQAIQQNPQMITIAKQNDGEHITEIFYRCLKDQKMEALLRVLSIHHQESTLVFCATKDRCREVESFLDKKKINVLAINSDLDQRERERVLVHFANKSCSVLIATDVAARGIDVKNMQLVVNFDLSPSADVHVHRVGRTGRAGESGVAVSLFSDHELHKIKAIEELQNKTITPDDLDLDGALKPLAFPSMITLAINSGKKSKLRPADILGALTKSAGIPFAKIGKIDIYDTHSYVAVERSVANQAMKSLNNGKIKGRNLRVSYS